LYSRKHKGAPGSGEQSVSYDGIVTQSLNTGQGVWANKPLKEIELNKNIIFNISIIFNILLFILFSPNKIKNYLLFSAFSTRAEKKLLVATFP